MKILLAIIVAIFAVFYYPYVCLYGWENFVVPLGVPSVGYWHMFALASLIGLMSRAYTSPLAKNPEYEGDGVVLLACGYTLGLAMAHGIFWLIAN